VCTPFPKTAGVASGEVRPDIAERVLGHVQGGVFGIYDRHQYREEKADALKKLAALIDTIVNPPGDNVVPITKKERPLNH
jgi:hypothetical protein